jgi:hypothetical protein
MFVSADANLLELEIIHARVSVREDRANSKQEASLI